MSVINHQKVKILLSNTDLYKFQIANVFYDSIIKILLRKYPNIFKNYVNINEDEIDNLIKSTNQNVREILSRLDNKGNKVTNKIFQILL